MSNNDDLMTNEIDGLENVPGIPLLHLGDKAVGGTSEIKPKNSEITGGRWLSSFEDKGVIPLRQSFGSATEESDKVQSFLQGSGLKNLATPSDVLKAIGNMAENMTPIPAGTLLAMKAKALSMFTGGQPMSETMKAGMGELTSLAAPYLFDDAQLDGKELVQLVAKVANKTQHTEAAPAIVNEARQTLDRLGIPDGSGEMAKGLAKASVAGAISTQAMLYAAREIQSRQPTAGMTLEEPFVSQPPTLSPAR